ncbi:MAG TPA: LemA family protein [Bacilli bacterium]|jgi:LemA protein|nr:LemA family protein [Bacilli bacterium]HPZ23230.1 LemA family protein [Bacilli bacterium]HQC83602.1 LemA family protein [Bacilli bacterium]
MVWIILIAIVVVLLLIIGATYNSLVQLRNKVRDQFSQIDVQLKKRFDLIPNLVETVKGYAKHESETFEAVIKARNSYQTAKTDDDKIAANQEITTGLSKLFALAENYPELKANTNFLDLQSQLKDIEDKIAYSRQFYNDSVLSYNNKVEMFPSNIIAGMFNFKTEKFFEASNEEKENVQVKF